VTVAFVAILSAVVGCSVAAPSVSPSVVAPSAAPPASAPLPAPSDAAAATIAPRPTERSTASAPPEPAPTRNTLAVGSVIRATRSVTLADAGWRIRPGQLAYVVEGPTASAAGELSYRLQTWGDLTTGLRPSTVFGSATAEGAEEAFESSPPACPGGPPALDEIARLEPFERLVCFGSQTLTFGPVTVRKRTYGGLHGTPMWLTRPSTEWLTSDGDADFFTAVEYQAHPSLPGRMPVGHGWFDVTGHFDDEAAATCEHSGGSARGWSTTDSVVWCRERFVVTGFRRVEPPATELRGEWRTIAQAPMRGRTGHVMAWTGREVIVWGGGEDRADPSLGYARPVATGGAYDPETDRWRTIDPAPITGRAYAVSAWTGSELLVWGGRAGGGEDRGLIDGAAYDPRRDRWRLLPSGPLESSSSAVSALVDGRWVIVTDSGTAAYDPAGDRWRELPAAPIRPGWRIGAAVGDHFVVIAFGDGATPPVEGAVLDARAGSWRTFDVPLDPGVAGVGAFATDRVVVLPGAGRSFDPASRAWSTVRACGGAEAGGVWTGTLLLGVYGAYVPAEDSCLALPLPPPHPEPHADLHGREFPIAVWTGTDYITWSGRTGADTVSTPSDGVAFRPRR
jgi:hypothetical protein